MLNYFKKSLFLIGIVSPIFFLQASHAMIREYDKNDDYGSYPGYPRYYESNWSKNSLSDFARRDIEIIHSRNSKNPWVVGYDDDKAHLADTNTALGWCYNRFIAKKGNVEVTNAVVCTCTDETGEARQKGNFGGIAYVKFSCYYKYPKSKQEELQDLEIEIKRLQLEKLRQELGK